MSAADEILAQIPLSQLAGQLGVGEDEAEQAVRQAVPALLGGMQANAQDPGGAASLQRAIGQHSSDPFEGLDLAQVDTADGDKIVDHVFGGNRAEVVNRLGGQGSDGGVMGKLLPMLAPLVLGWLARRLGGGQAGGTDSAPGGLDDLLGGLTGGGGLGDLLGGSGGGGGGFGDLLGGLLGGDSSAGGSDIGDLLGGLLGGGTKG